MSVRKKGNKWYCRFQIDGIEYERACKGASDEKAALKCETIIKAEIMHGNYNFGKSENPTKLSEGVKIFYTHSKTNKLSYSSDIVKINKFIEFFGSNTPLKTITPSKINEFKDFIKEKPVVEKVKVPNPEYGKKGIRKKTITIEITKTKILSNATINRYIEVLSKMFNLCIEQGLIDKNPCQIAGKLREENYKIRFLTKEEEDRLYNILNAEYAYLIPIVTTALQTGMRKSEILNLKWSQIDLNKGFIEILKTKSGKARKIPISNKLDIVLKNLLIEKQGEYVFVNPKTNQPYKDIKKAFASVLKYAEIENFRFHDLRHTVATRMVEKGIDLIVVKEILGHASIETTMRYAHPVPERKKQAVNIL